MQELDVVLRVAAATLLLVLALLLARDAWRHRIVWFFVPFALGLCGFLAGNTPDAGLTLSGGPAALAGLLSGNAAVFLWWFCLALFDDDFRPGPLALGIGGTWFIIALLDRGILDSGFPGTGLSWVLVGMGVAMVGHLAYRLLRDLEGDLVEARRSARSNLVAAVAMLLLLDLGVDVVLGFDWKPQWFTVAQNAAILLVAARLTGWLLRGDASVLTFRSAGAAAVAPAGVPAPAPRQTGSAPDPRLLCRLNELMVAERIHRDPDLTFAAFVARMGAPEAEVRRLVNQQLGARHFRSFLNAHRVEEARAALADPARANDKMVAIAFDAGFASLASFNRAFKLAEGQAPTGYRADVLRIDRSRDERVDPDGSPEAEQRLRTGF
ncbi:AraC family transcriptional regulator [Lysobacter sp. D1-1-M9]|uniref:AraC family transcriptional regulator n=1 Tax=Novilysobacter longmucuonensis TaxID=3098603 RepID=UPI002FCC5A79